MATERTEKLMSAVWEARNSGADTEEKLVAAIIRILADNVTMYNAQNGIVVLDRNDLLSIANDLDPQ